MGLLCFFMLVPLQVTLLPNYLLLDAFGLLNTYWALLLPLAFAPLGTFLLTQIFRSVSADILQAARLDGAGDGRIFTRILLPLIKPQIELATMFTLLNGLKIYDSVVSLTGGGPSRQTVVLPMWIIENAFTYSNFGYASAMCIAFIIVVLIF